MTESDGIRFPGESAAYRAARNDLLAAETELRRQVERVAALRRALPPGGAVPQDYRFQGADGPVTLSRLFRAGCDTLVLYGFMLAAGGPACPMCTAFLDSLDGAAPHLARRIGLAVAAKAPYPEITAFAKGRGWRHLRLVSSAGSSFNADYHAEAGDAQMPMLNVFQRTPAGIVHRWGSEMLYAPSDDGQNPRHMDMMWPLWNVLDVTPAGRGADWYPALSYE